MTNKEAKIQEKIITRDDLLKITTNAIQMIQYKIVHGRFKDINNEKIRIQYWKTLNGFIKTSASLMMDQEIETLYNEIKNLKITNTTINSSNADEIKDKIDAINEIESRLNELNKNKGAI